MGTEPFSELPAEARRVAASAAAQGVALRVLGGVAVSLRCPSALAPPLQRPYGDLDLVGRSGDRRRITSLMVELGYDADAQFNTVHGATRLIFRDPINTRHVDVFLDRFEMCHTLDLRERVEIAGETLPLADLLLTKLQVVETNDKDLLDVLALLADHPFTADDSGINLPYIQALTATDWGLWRTTSSVAERAAEFAERLPKFAGCDAVRRMAAAYGAALAESVKTSRWKLRARIGERKRWYELPEET